ncbi:MAG: hydroxymethylglutaryl-CoA lyase [Bacteroidetes bacterium]|nr:hydroxymethylglutaryl-CoA lyase [Bacteroidota bacterium]
MTSFPIKLIECPRDAMQGWPTFIPTETKVSYLNKLLEVGFDTLDFGSFVSPKAIPQLRDTREVLEGLRLDGTSTKLLSIIANVRGAEEAAAFDEISFLGFPFSISQEFQRRNTNSTIEESLVRVEEIQEICIRSRKELVVYISMGFGNPYGEEWSPEIVIHWVKKMDAMGIRTIALSDTIGVSNPDNIKYLFSKLIPAIPEVEFGAHLHSLPQTREEKIRAAFESGCRRFDAALNGIGGCPMADDDLVGNLATESLIGYFGGLERLNLNESAYKEALVMANEIFH